MDAGGALVGRIMSGRAYDAKSCWSTTPPPSSVGSEADTGATGTITGQIGGQLRMSDVNATETLTEGAPQWSPRAMVLPGTAHVTSRSPIRRGLLIGTITQALQGPEPDRSSRRS